jgi:hypothetical protein
MERFLGVVCAIILLVGCSDSVPPVGDDEPVSSADQLVGRWRDIESTDIRTFQADGTTSIQGTSPAGLPTSSRNGTYRFVSPGKIEISMEDGQSTEWTVTFGGSYAGSRLLKIRGSDGRTYGYVRAETVPPYAPTSAQD